MAEIKEDRQTFAAEYIKSDWDKAVYLDSPHTDNLMSAFLNLGAEFWVLRRRQIITEKLMSEGVKVTPEAIDAYNPSDEEKALWEEERDEFINRVFSVLTRPGATRVSGAAPSTVRAPALTKP